MIAALLSGLLFLRSSVPSAPAVAAALERLAKRPIWEGFDPVRTPLAVYDGERTWLFRHPAPPTGFVPVLDLAGAFVREGRLAEVAANSSERIGGVVTATLLLPGTTRSADEVAATAIHELFHVWEREHHPEWAANEVALLHYPFADAEALALRRLEHEALRRAIAAKEPAPWAAAALALRRDRFVRIPADAAAYERATEENEGLAQYVEDLALQRQTGRLALGAFDVEQIRQGCYATGQAMALLLDRCDSEWRGRLSAGIALDVLLEAALRGARAATFTSAERAVALRRARAEVGALEMERARVLQELLSRPGWAIVVIAREGEPLFPERFDPWNLRLLAPSSVLHSRALRASNAAGVVEVFGRDALSEASGADPLFTGMRRVQITGLQAPPEVTNGSDGSVEAKGEGLSLRFAAARVSRRGKTVEVRLGE